MFRKLLLSILTLPLIVTADPVTTNLHFQEFAPPSLADHTHISKKRDPVDGGWLPDLTGLPNKFQLINIANKVNEIVDDEKDAQCKAVDSRLRKVVFQDFLVYQHIANAQGSYFDESTAHRWAHILGMILKESSGDPTNISDMQSHSISTFQPMSDIAHWNKILTLVNDKRVKLNYQTNFGLTQTSSDRLFVAFKLSKDNSYDVKFLEGRANAAVPRKINLNTAIAIRRLLWFFQDFAQGRITDSDKRIHQRDLNNPEYAKKFHEGIDMALLYCGTPLLFKEGKITEESMQNSPLHRAMESIAYCKLGNAQSGYGENNVDALCYGQWVTLCPALNVSIATLTPLEYFQTRNTPPVCEKTFDNMIHHKNGVDYIKDLFNL